MWKIETETAIEISPKKGFTPVVIIGIAGCFFKNPASGEIAGQLIEMAGLKGKSVGGAKISSKHANFFINRHKASAADFLALINLAEKVVLEKFNVHLEREVKVVGA